MPADTPETVPVSDDASAVARVASLLSEPSGAPESSEPEKPREEEPTEDVSHETSEEEAPEQASSEESEGAEPDEAESESLPDTITGLAEALEVEPSELLAHLKAEVKVNDKVSQVTLEEAVRGYQRQADYDEKMTRIAEQRREMETLQQHAAERWQQQSERLDTAIQSLEQGLEAGPSAEEMMRLMEDDPSEYLRVQARQQAQKERLEKAKAERDGVRQQQAEEHYARIGQYRTEQQRLLTQRIPDLSDTKKLQAFEKDMNTYLDGQGFSEQEVGSFVGGAFDHRHILIVRDAMRFRQLQQGKKEVGKKLQALPKVQKPGAAPPKAKSDTDKLVASKNRLRQLGKKGRAGRAQQNAAAVDLIKRIL